MFGIGGFARHGQVSVRMLRHYDAIGLWIDANCYRATGNVREYCLEVRPRPGETPVTELQQPVVAA
jgi:DNA-binding transcriptional MerR regulator